VYCRSGSLAVVRPRDRDLGEKDYSASRKRRHGAESRRELTGSQPTSDMPNQTTAAIVATHLNQPPRLACRVRAKAGSCARARRLLVHAANVRRRRADLGEVVGWRAASRRPALVTSRPARKTRKLVLKFLIGGADGHAPARIGLNQGGFAI
jgi:hypothetical protein